jgi:hypothetical protein
MQAWEEDSIQHVAKAGSAARIGAIERKWPGFPAKPDHGAPFFHYCVLFGHEHANFSIQTTMSINARAFAAKASECSRRCSPMRFATSDTPAEISVLRNESVSGLERSN